MVCMNWGCGKEYKYDDNPTNNKRSCQYHPGAFEFGSVNGLWPEQWTCCRKEWEATGCKIGKHKGIIKANQIKLCLNHGEQNPKTHYPDSYCGVPVKQDEQDGECVYHSGYFISNRITGEERWTCCEPVNGMYTPCVSTTHKFAQWPAEEAKKLFVKKQFIDYSQKDHEQQPFSVMGMTSDYFKPVKPYNEAESKRRQYEQKLIDTENDDRYCMNWGCEKTYTLYQNRKKLMCRYHPGRYDFGHTGLTIAQTIGEYGRGESDVIWWKPHWTCCRGEWAAKGCQRGRHNGPLVSEMEIRKYKWPSEHAMKYFKKVSSHLWDQKIEKEGILDPERVGQIVDRLMKKYNGNIPLSEIVTLSDQLKLYILNSSSDLSFHFKFLDIMDNQLSAITEDGSTIDRQKFMNWWLSDLETVRPL